MGSSTSYLGPAHGIQVVFPSTTSISTTNSMVSEMEQMRPAIAVMQASASVAPAVGPILNIIFSLLAFIDDNSQKDAWVKTKIDERLTQSSAHTMNAELSSIADSLSRIRNGGINQQALQIEAIYALRRSKYLLSLFQNQDHVFWKYPLVTIPYFATTVNVLVATLNLSSKVDPTLAWDNNRVLDELPTLISSYILRFIVQRVGKITTDSCGGLTTIYDQPWDRNKWCGSIKGVYGHHGLKVCAIDDDMEETCKTIEYESAMAYAKVLVNGEKGYMELFNKMFPIGTYKITFD